MTSVRFIIDRSKFCDGGLYDARGPEIQVLLEQIIITAEYPSLYWLNHQRYFAMPGTDLASLPWAWQDHSGRHYQERPRQLSSNFRTRP